MERIECRNSCLTANRLLTGIDAPKIARNCRTSLFVIDNYCAKDMKPKLINLGTEK